MENIEGDWALNAVQVVVQTVALFDKKVVRRRESDEDALRAPAQKRL